jgi:curli biogenesis system outer membrane secretion channel CsgG
MRATACLFVGLSLLATDSAWPQEGEYRGPKLRIAVMESMWDPGLFTETGSFGAAGYSYNSSLESFAQGLTEMMITELLQHDRFLVIERQAIADVLAEQNLQYSGAVNPETAVQAGRVIGAQFFVRPVITTFSYGEKGRATDAAVTVPVDVPVAGGIRIGGGKKTVQARLVIDSRIYDVETSQITVSVTGEGSVESKSSQVSLDTDVLDVGTSGFEDTPLGEATRAAVQEVVANIIAELGDVPWQGRVVTVRGGQIYINAGSDAGMRVGDMLEVSRVGEELIDPETGLNLGQVEDTLGRLRITSVEEKFSIAAPVGSVACERSDIVRYVGGGS